jgi:hypothetical protein
MDKGRKDKLEAIARLNGLSVSFKDGNGAIIATARGVSFTVTSYMAFDAKLKEIKRMSPQKRSFLNRLLGRNKVS